jgi:hypothetical protein
MERDKVYWHLLDEMRDPRRSGEYFVPKLILDIFRQLLDGLQANSICDPWAGIGRLIVEVKDISHAEKALAITKNSSAATMGKEFAKDVNWHLGNPLDYLSKTDITFDIIASILPFGVKYYLVGSSLKKYVKNTSKSGEIIELKGDLEDIILAYASLRLNEGGIGIYITTPRFLNSSVFKQLETLGLGMEAAIQLPPGTFAPVTNISTNLVIIRKHQVLSTFIAEFSIDSTTNAEIISNFKNGQEGKILELGKFEDSKSFKGIKVIKHQERIKQAELLFGFPAIKLGDISLNINMGHFGERFEFPKMENSIFIPLVGPSDVLDSSDNLTLHNQNYAQAIIDSARSNSRFVARFLNSELGKEIIGAYKRGTTISRLSKQSLMEMEIFIPDLATQKEMLEIEARITSEENILLGLQNEIEKYRRELWSNPKSIGTINRKLQVFTTLISDRLKQHADENLEQWVETLPFPLASIIRTYQATTSQDYQNKVTHLLHFFEATAEFMSVILLSAFSVNEEFFHPHKQKLLEIAHKYNLSFQHATFGTWKLVVEYLGKQIRQMLSDVKDSREACSNMFASTSLELPEMLSNAKLVDLLSQTNQMRNYWVGHTGYVTVEESLLRNEQLIGKLQELREIMAGIWNRTQLINALSCKPRSGSIEYDIAILMGSNPEFLKEVRNMSEYLYIDCLYIAQKDSKRALKLLPLIEISPSPQSAKNACYFFNRTEKDGMRYIAYHFSEKSERVEPFGEMDEGMKLFVEGR